jgi:hypothetical protein
VAQGEELHFPLHAVAVSTIDLEKVKTYMRPDVRERFETTYQRLCAGVTSSVTTAARNALTAADTEALLRVGILERAEEHPDMVFFEPFTVVEERDGTCRRRFISWTRILNNEQALYEPWVDVDGPRKMLPATQQEYGMKRDLTAGFYQIELPMDARNNFAIRGEDGTVYRLTRMPMGHVCAPEIMQTTMAVIAGCPKVCAPEHVIGVPHRDVYIDGLRGAGSEHQIQQYAEKVDERAVAVNATFKTSESYEGTEYTFNGVRYNHVEHTVEIGDKLRKRLETALPIKTYGDVETLLGRLMYASIIAGVDLPAYYFGIKFARRRINEMARGMRMPSDNIAIPVATDVVLRRWVRDVLRSKPWSPTAVPPGAQHVTLYTDASLTGWGAVLFTGLSEPVGTGAPWYKQVEINHAEVDAVYHALVSFKGKIPPWSVVQLYIDNTAAKRAIEKCSSKSENVSHSILRVIKLVKANKWYLQPEYIRSKENLADVWSRMY